MAIEIGQRATVQRRVGNEHTASAVGSGDVDVLGTPQVVAWCEAATVAAIASGLGPEETTVGTQVQIDHLRATPLGGTVRAGATLIEIDGRRLTFEVDAADDVGQVASGRVVRIVVDRQRFMAQLPND